MSEHWVAAWGASPNSAAVLSPCMYSKDMTLRYILRTGIAGNSVRLRFSNMAGKETVFIPKVTVMRPDGSNCTPVLFGGKQGLAMDAGGSGVSDPVEFAVEPGDDILVSMYLDRITCLGTGVKCIGPLSRAWFAEGDWCEKAELSVMHSMTMQEFYFLTEMDVAANASSKALVAFGDSITAQSWPYYLVLRLQNEGDHNLSVVRRGIGGSRIFGQYENLEHRRYGRKGPDRFAEEISADGVDRIIVLHGINDLLHPGSGHPCRPISDLPDAEKLIGGLKTYIGMAHDKGMKIFLATITPFGGWPSWTPEREMIRLKVNDWIRTTDEHDGFIDSAAALEDPECRSRMKPEFDSGDHVHPSLLGANRIAECIPQEFLHN